MKRVFFEDRGQDTLWWDVHPWTGMILACGPWGEHIWVGRAVLDELMTGIHPVVEYKGRRMRVEAKIERIEDKK